MTPRDAAKALGLEPQVVLGWVKSGRCPSQMVATANGPRYSVEVDDVRACAEAVPAVAPDASAAPEEQTGHLKNGKAPAIGPPYAPIAVASVNEVEDLRQEVHDLRAQLFQMETRLKEAVEAASVRGPVNRELRDLLMALEKRLELMIREPQTKRR